MKNDLRSEMKISDLDLAEFWELAAQAPQWRRKHTPLEILRWRFNDDGSVKQTYTEIAKQLNVTRNRPRELERQAVMLMRRYYKYHRWSARA